MDFGAQLQFALLLAIPIACIAWTVTQEEVFKELREGLARYQRRHANSLWRQKLAYMPTCPYCFSHYVAALFLVLVPFKMLADDWRGYVISLFTLVLIANVYITLYNLLRAGLRALKTLADRAEAEDATVHRPATGSFFGPSRAEKHASPLTDRFPAVADGAARNERPAPRPAGSRNELKLG